MNVRKTKSGWVVEITNTVHGVLEQGGVAGKEVLYKTDTLESVGIDYNADPEGDYNGMVTNLDALVNNAIPDKILKAGHEIR